jgi:hypothetical protein
MLCWSKSCRDDQREASLCAHGMPKQQSTCEHKAGLVINARLQATSHGIACPFIRGCVVKNVQHKSQQQIHATQAFPEQQRTRPAPPTHLTNAGRLAAAIAQWAALAALLQSSALCRGGMVSRGAPRTGKTEEEVPPGVWGPVCCWVVTTIADTQARVLDTPKESDTNKTTTKDSVMAQRQARGGGGCSKQTHKADGTKQVGTEPMHGCLLL